MARYASKGTVNVYLPGDREIFALAEATARDARQNPEEYNAMMAAWLCARRKMFARHWKCTRERPCALCKEIHR